MNTYNVADFHKYRDTNTTIPEEMTKYMISEPFIVKHSLLDNQETYNLLDAYIKKFSVEGKDASLYESIQYNLNKLSQKNFDEISREIVRLPYTEKAHVYKVAECIIMKGVNEPTYVDIYMKLIQKLIPFYVIDSETGNKFLFRTALVTIAQEIYTDILHIPHAKAAYDRCKNYDTINFANHMKFIGELYNYDIINSKVIKSCFDEVYNKLKAMEIYDFDAIGSLANTVYRKIRATEPPAVNYMRNNLKTLIDMNQDKANAFKFKSKREQFKVEDIIKALVSN